MALLEKEGPEFSDKMLVTVLGEGRGAARESRLDRPLGSFDRRLVGFGGRLVGSGGRLNAVGSGSMLFGQTRADGPRLRAARLPRRRGGAAKALPRRLRQNGPPGNDDRGLLYQADAGASVLGAIAGFFRESAAASAPGGRPRVVHRLAVFNALGGFAL